MSNISLNDEAWEKLFDKYRILHHVETDGYFQISAAQIKEFREPRLMAKFDHTVNLPKLFSDNGLAILPVTRGDYVISHFKAYHDFEEEDSQITKVSLPTHVQSLNGRQIPSEAIALNCAVASGIISDFMEDSDIVATVSGRMGSGSFSFDIDDAQTGASHHVNVNNSQIEIDAAYEGIESLALFEAKRELSDDFLVRQLYYPFRVWQGRVSKPVKPIFLIYSNGIFRIYEYAFEDPNCYSSIQLVKQKMYSIEDTAISIDNVKDVLRNAHVIDDEPKIPFPQADKFERVVNLCELISVQELSREDVTERYAFTSRQADYYAQAVNYLGLLDKRDDGGTTLYSLNEKGRKILNLDFKTRQLAFCSCILSHRAFHSTLCRYFDSGNMPSTAEIVEIMKESRLYNVGSDSTFERRSQSIKGWINWILSLAK